LATATALVLGASGIALADDSSMSRFGGESYAYFNRPALGNVPATAGWRQSHPNGLTERELQAYSSSDLSVFAAQLNPPLLASAPADPSWRQSHPKGLTERELQALSASSVSAWQAPDQSAATTDVAGNPGYDRFSARLKKVFSSLSGTQADSYQ
jgi:hypothetical protein